ncbi:hypothetical protein [Prevotella intermedia]|uniref:hypothetical protein n=1 Tax=Prevotella intermedia TaxID=28131 RepID=UPI000BE6FE79|nr:hypothetical protein [Prevotella intermedia]PDP82231.1 hypothetical protein CLI69_05680 [Prevotella intermedia]
MALRTRGSNFAASDKPVFHGFENIHFEKIKHRISMRIYLRRSKWQGMSCVTRNYFGNSKPLLLQRAEHLRSRCSWIEVFVVLIDYFIVNAL